LFARERIAAFFCREDIGSIPVFRHHREPAFRFLYAAPIRASARGQLGIAIRTEQSEIPRVIVSVVAVLVIEDRLEQLSVPDKRLGVKDASPIVASHGQRRVLL
jgi:hypothetical protein